MRVFFEIGLNNHRFFSSMLTFFGISWSIAVIAIFYHMKALGAFDKDAEIWKKSAEPYILSVVALYSVTFFQQQLRGFLHCFFWGESGVKINGLYRSL